jgi:sugar phosphate permease
VPAAASSTRFYYGWAVLLVAAAAMVGTLPGRTQGLGLVTEPILAERGLERVQWAHINFWATLIGSFGAIGIGRILDRHGSRVVLTGTVLALGAIVWTMAGTTSWVAMALLVTLTRGVGQSALSVISLAMVGQWFVRRLTVAMAVYAVVMSVGFMTAFPLVGGMVQARGWRTAWMSIGVALFAALAPLAWLVVRRSPEACGLQPDGGAPREPLAPAPLTGWDWRAAVANRAFWVFALGSALYGLVAACIGLFNESILA